MADSYSCNINIDPDGSGNMYYRGAWQFCPEYKTGDVVLHNGVLYLCVKPHAGKDPVDIDNREYWAGMSGSQQEESETATFKTLDGGYATTNIPDSHVQTTQATAIDGGSSNGRRYMPLV